MNLAPIKYARVLASAHGPIERIEYGRVEICGQVVYQANAYLSKYLNLDRPGRKIFGGADGTGTHRTAIMARYKAISEAIERWAYHYLDQIRQEQLYGHAWDSSTGGMSAYPGLFKYTARNLARLEAVERYCLASWWGEKLGCTEIRTGYEGVKGIRIANPLSPDHVVVTWKRSSQGFYGYGFSAGRNSGEACWKAVVEMDRSIRALDWFYRENPGLDEGDLDILDNHMERRMFYFSLPAGHEEFLAKTGNRRRAETNGDVMPVFDNELKGPWRKYATVWRIIYPVATREHLLPHLNCFFW